MKILYEGMFLVDSALATAEWDGVVATIKNVLERSKAELVSLRKWDDRRLAYDIRGKNRGVYILTYFKADGDRIRDIERDVQLSERIMRVLVLNAEKQPPEIIEKATPAEEAEGRRPEQPSRAEQEKPGATPESQPAVSDEASGEVKPAEEQGSVTEPSERSEEQDAQSASLEVDEQDGPQPPGDAGEKKETAD